MNQDLVGHTLYCLYEIFFANLDQDKLVLLALSSKEINNLMIHSGGFAKSIYFDWTGSFNDFFDRLSMHSRIEKMTFDGSPAQLCILDFLPLEGIKMLILKNNYNTCLIRENTNPINSSQLKRPAQRRLRNKTTSASTLSTVGAKPLRKQDNCWAELEYLFITDDRGRTFDIGSMNFPNLRFIGSYKAIIMFNQVGSEPGVPQRTDQSPYMMGFKDNYSFELMHKKKSTGLPKIVNLLKNIYR